MNIIIITLIIVTIYYFFLYKIENMTNIESQQIIDKIFNYIISNNSNAFADYINFLTSIKNTNLHIIDNEVFVTFKLLQNKKMFSKNDIISAMKL